MKENKKIRDLEVCISKNRSISKNCRKYLLWLFVQTKGFTESVSMDVQWYFDPTQEDLDRAFRTLMENAEFNRLFKAAAPGYLLSVGYYWSIIYDKPVMAVSLYNDLVGMKFLESPLPRDFRKILLRFK